MNLFFELIQVSIYRREALSRVPSPNEWISLFRMAQKQALVGICFIGVQRLPKEQREEMPKGLMMQWFALAEGIRQRNALVNERVCELQRLLNADGLRACVLKGQGVAELYNLDLNLNLYRQSGDIDVWVDGERDEIIRYMKAHYKCGKAVIHHIDVEVFDDVPVEVHFLPSYAYCLPRYRAYRRFFKAYKDECFVSSGLGFCVPSLRFNVVYMLMHIFRHVFHEGIGLRQLMDYYFLLKNFNVNLDLNVNRNQKVNATFRSLGMERFVGAVMWLLQEVFGLERELMLCEPSEKYGRRLLDIVMVGGNFGRYDRRNRHGKENDLQRGFRNLRHNMQVVKDYPSEVLWAPFWKVGHFVWRKCKGL